MSELRIGQTKSYLQSKAEVLDCGLVIPTEFELTIDLDKGMSLNVAVEKTLEPFIADVLMTISKSKNQHIYYRLYTGLPIGERIALQAALGSDPIREALSALDTKCEVPIAFFETPKEFLKVTNWRAKFNG